MKECIHSVAIRDFKGCSSTAGGKNTLVCEFPDWEGMECPFDMLQKRTITELQFFKLWLRAISIDLPSPDPTKV